MIKFTKDQELSTSSIGDSNCIFRATVIKRTEKTVTITARNESTKRCKIHDFEGVEVIYPYGRYSMCTTFHANK